MPANAETSDQEAASEATAVTASKSNDASEASANSSTGDSAAQESAEAADSSASNANSNADASAAAAAKAAPALEDANSATQISSASDFANLRNGGSYQLANDITVSDTVFVSANTSLDLNGHTINYTGNSSLFHVQNGGSLTITDSQAATDNKADVSGDVYGNEASVSYSNGVPTQLTYYVTESTPSSDGTSTAETLYQHTVTPGGIITATNGSGANSVIYMDGGTLNVEGGTICMPNSASHGSDCHIINVEGGTFNLSGGYIVGGQRTSNWGGGVHLSTAKGSGTTLNMTGGVIAANKAKAGAGIYAENGTTVNVSGGAISGNVIPDATIPASKNASEGPAGDGYGAGIYAVGATVSVTDGYITNNKNLAKYGDSGQGLIGGGGIAIVNDSSQASLSVSGGYITGNYAESAGGGIYAGRYKKGLGEHFKLSGGTVASNVSNLSEGGGIRVSSGTTATFSVPAGSHAYITNNKCNSTFDWGGGGMFVQEGGFVAVLNALITNNTAGGYGGGFAACPTGETVITHTQGAAIYDNTDARSSMSANMSGGGHGKNEDQDARDNATFRTNGHADYFLVRKSSNNSYISVVTGRMLGDGAANWSGSVDGTATTIDANSGAAAKYMVGLTANPSDAAKSAAIAAATLTISGNYSHNHGGGIMTNGGVVLGHVENIYTYPGLSFTANKSLVQDGADASSQLTDVAYHFVLLSSESDSQKPSWNADGTLNYGGCAEVTNVTNSADGTISFGASSQYSSSGTYRYYVAELPNSTDADKKTQSYNQTIYQIDADVELSSSTKLLDITFNHYSIKSLTVTVIAKDGTKTTYTPSTTTNSDNSVSFTLVKSLGKDGSTTPAFTNTLKPYSTSGSFTPEVKKHVEGGEVKSWQFELYDEKGYDNGKWDGAALQTKTTTKSDSSDAAVTFDTINYTNLGVSDLTGGKGGTKTYTYYIREKSGSDNGYTFDGGYCKVVVTAKDTPASDNFSGTLTTTATYTYVDAKGNESSTSTTDPTFNNKYATQLPNAGQSGIALAYVAGAALLAVGLGRLVQKRHQAGKGGDE
ncbi:MAG: Spy0128 family protein [Atopobiaceae bacterium]